MSYHVFEPAAGRRMRRFVRGAAALLLGGVVLTLASACGGESGGGGSPRQPDALVTLTDSGCEPARLDLAPGRTKFVVRNPGDSRTNQFQITRDGRLELVLQNIIGGLARSGDVDLDVGTYAMRCGSDSYGGDGTIVVTE